MRLVIVLILFINGVRSLTKSFRREVWKVGDRDVRMRLDEHEIYSVRVALTREQEENAKLKDLLPGINCMEVPCITFSTTNVVKTLLPKSITHYDTTILTSPKAASIYLEAWKSAGSPSVKIATVGKGTSLPVLQEGLIPVFEPTEATGDALSSELPIECGPRILYPSSALADNKIVVKLEARGFKVRNIYNVNVFTDHYLRLIYNGMYDTPGLSCKHLHDCPHMLDGRDYTTGTHSGHCYIRQSLCGEKLGHACRHPGGGGGNWSHHCRCGEKSWVF